MTHGFAFRLIANMFRSYMQAIGAENYVAQEIEIIPKASSSMPDMVILVGSRRWWVAIREAVAAATKGLHDGR